MLTPREPRNCRLPEDSGDLGTGPIAFRAGATPYRVPGAALVDASDGARRAEAAASVGRQKFTKAEKREIYVKSGDDNRMWKALKSQSCVNARPTMMR